MWHLVHKKVIYIYKNDQPLKAEGHFKDKPEVQWVYDVRPYSHQEKDYVVVSLSYCDIIIY